MLLRTCLPLNRNRTVLLAAVAAAFAAVVMIAGKHFELVPLAGNSWIALLILAALGGAIVFGTAFLIRRRKWDEKGPLVRLTK